MMDSFFAAEGKPTDFKKHEKSESIHLDAHMEGVKRMR